MSDTLTMFVGSLVNEIVPTTTSLRALIAMAAEVWNAAVLGDRERIELLNQSRHVSQVRYLFRRFELLFKGDQRLVTKAVVDDSGKGISLDVEATLDPAELAAASKPKPKRPAKTKKKL